MHTHFDNETEHDHDHDKEICIICLEVLENENIRIKKLGCNHAFHCECLEEWESYSKDSSCPICRTAYEMHSNTHDLESGSRFDSRTGVETDIEYSPSPNSLHSVDQFITNRFMYKFHFMNYVILLDIMFSTLILLHSFSIQSLVDMACAFIGYYGIRNLKVVYLFIYCMYRVFIFTWISFLTYNETIHIHGFSQITVPLFIYYAMGVFYMYTIFMLSHMIIDIRKHRSVIRSILLRE